MSKKQIKNRMRKYIILIIIVILIVIGVCLYIIFNNKIKIKEYENDSYYLKYNSSWTLKRNTNEEVSLVYNRKAKINIKISYLEDEKKYLTIDKMVDNILYDIGIQNTNYRLLSKDTFINKDGDSGYKFLYENDENQVLVSLYKKNNKLVVFTYEALNEYCDILLDNALDVLYYFKIKNETYLLNNKISINNQEIKFNENEIDNSLKGSNEYDIANNNYYIKYTLPENFKLNNIDSTYDSFVLSTEDGDINLTVNLFNSNVFDFIDSLKNSSKDSSNYSDYSEVFTKYGNDSYVYKINYVDQNNSIKVEKINLLYKIDKNHTLCLEFNSTNSSISKNIVDSFKVKDIKEYSKYITSKVENNMLIGSLMRKNNETIEEISIKLPNNYEEYQLSNENVYQTKNYGLSFNENKQIYNYTITYNLTNIVTKESDLISTINSTIGTSYGKYQKLVKGKNIAINNKNFIVYDGGESKVGGTANTMIDRFNYYTNIKLLLYRLDTGGYLVIKIRGNGINITNDIINDVTNIYI